MIIEAARGVFVATSAIDSTTSTMIVSGGDCVVVDPAWTPGELDALAAEIAGRGWTVTAGLATHAHHDHLLWHPDFGSVPRWASAGSVQMVRDHFDELLAALRAGCASDPRIGNPPPWYEDLFAQIEPVPTTILPATTLPADTLPTADEPMELVVHDAHAPGHTALWLAGRRVLIAGDMLSDTELPLPFDPDDVPAYLRGLDVLEPYVRRARLLIPGHGTPTADPMARLRADRTYFDDLRAGRTPRDRRIDLPGMAEVHGRLRELVGR